VLSSLRFRFFGYPNQQILLAAANLAEEGVFPDACGLKTATTALAGIQGVGEFARVSQAIIHAVLKLKNLPDPSNICG